MVTDRQQLAELAKAATGGGAPAPPPAIIALIAPGGERRQRALYDLGQVTMSIMLAAAGLGIGSGHASVTDQDLARQVLGFPEDKVLPVPDHAGLPGRAAGPDPPPRPPPVRRSSPPRPLVAHRPRRPSPVVTAIGGRPAGHGGKQ